MENSRGATGSRFRWTALLKNTFDNLAEVAEAFTEAIGVKRGFVCI
jgi:hypothetical protein